MVNKLFFPSMFYKEVINTHKNMTHRALNNSCIIDKLLIGLYSILDVRLSFQYFTMELNLPYPSDKAEQMQAFCMGQSPLF